MNEAKRSELDAPDSAVQYAEELQQIAEALGMHFSSGLALVERVRELAANVDSERIDKLQRICWVDEGFVNPAYGRVMLLIQSARFDLRSDPTPTIREVIDSLPNDKVRDAG